MNQKHNKSCELASTSSTQHQTADFWEVLNFEVA
jgi:hypothetical protein